MATNPIPFMQAAGQLAQVSQAIDGLQWQADYPGEVTEAMALIKQAITHLGRAVKSDKTTEPLRALARRNAAHNEEG